MRDAQEAGHKRNYLNLWRESVFVALDALSEIFHQARESVDHNLSGHVSIKHLTEPASLYLPKILPSKHYSLVYYL